MITDRDIRRQVETSLEGFQDDFDIDGIIDEIVATYGLVDIEVIDAEAYWEMVHRYDRGAASHPALSRAEVTAVFNVATVQLYDGDEPYGDGWDIRPEDGPGPVPGAEAVLERMGWRVVGRWTQTAGGVSGGSWSAPVRFVN